MFVGLKPGTPSRLCCFDFKNQERGRSWDFLLNFRSVSGLAAVGIQRVLQEILCCFQYCINISGSFVCWNETSAAAELKMGDDDGLFWKAEAMQNGSAAETDVFALTKSLPEVDK